MKLAKLTTLPDYKLLLEFDDGTKWEISLKQKLWTEVFSPLKKLDLFNVAKINRFWTAIIWNDTIDIDATNCYYKITWKEEIN